MKKAIKPTCQKCGSKQVALSYCDDTHDYEHSFGKTLMHASPMIHAYCQACAFQWLETPLDATPSGPPLAGRGRRKMPSEPCNHCNDQGVIVLDAIPGVRPIRPVPCPKCQPFEPFGNSEPLPITNSTQIDSRLVSDGAKAIAREIVYEWFRLGSKGIAGNPKHEADLDVVIAKTIRPLIAERDRLREELKDAELEYDRLREYWDSFKSRGVEREDSQVVHGCICPKPTERNGKWEFNPECQYHATAAKYRANHAIPWNCPTYYDGCNCVETVKRLQSERDQLVTKCHQLEDAAVAQARQIDTHENTIDDLEARVAELQQTIRELKAQNRPGN